METVNATPDEVAGTAAGEEKKTQRSSKEASFECRLGLVAHKASSRCCLMLSPVDFVLQYHLCILREIITTNTCDE